MFGNLAKKNREILAMIAPKPGEPFAAHIGGKKCLIALRRLDSAEGLAVSAYAEQAARTFIDLVGGKANEAIAAKVVAEAGARAFAKFVVVHADGKPYFPSIDDTKPASLDELAAISRVYDAVFNVTADDLKN